MSLLKKFGELLAHLNSEENELAAEFRKELESHIDDAEDDAEWLSALESAGVDNWEGYEFALDIRREWRGDSEE
ncbi:hypothetical protein MQM1_067 [Aeromonas phage vB_AsaP_MQM1]|nr:hypothetical protein MQM1_067 [Aeromonas phage vB_AsaP_MQM1]